MQIVNNITMLPIALTGAALIRKRQHWMVEYLLVMPVTFFEIMSSKIWVMIVVVLIASVFSCSSSCFELFTPVDICQINHKAILQYVSLTLNYCI